MSNQDQSINPGSDATTNNLAGTRDEFNDEVTARLVEEAESEKTESKKAESEKAESAERGKDPEEREDQPALETDDDNPASDGEVSS